MAEQGIAVRDFSAAISVKTKKENYVVSVGDQNLILVRDVDFGVIPGTKKPSLLKSGAERIVMSLGLSQHFITEQSIEDYKSDNPFFFYRFKCVLYYTMPDGREIVVTEGVGSANSAEKACGRANPFDTANARLKMAKKRALVDACLTVGQLSSMFSQDMENEDFVNSEFKVIDENAPITAKQVKLLYTRAGKLGVDKNKCAEIVASFGYASSKDIKDKDFDNILKAVEDAAGVVEV